MTQATQAGPSSKFYDSSVNAVNVAKATLPSVYHDLSSGAAFPRPSTALSKLSQRPGHQTRPAKRSGSIEVILPLPPAWPPGNNIENNIENNTQQKFEMEVYATFMRFLRHHPNNRLDIKILCGVQSVADSVRADIDLICKILVDLGLRAPRSAFPASFLEFCDKALLRHSPGDTQTILALHDLHLYWKHSH